jgi:hypothetical protein
LRFSHSKRGYLRQGRPYHCGAGSGNSARRPLPSAD